MKRTNRLIGAGLALLAHALCLSQPGIPGDEEVLARVGPHTITAKEYLERIELMPWPGKDNPGTYDSAKVNALAALVAEKLLSMQAVDQGFNQNEDVFRTLHALEQLFARDELYRTEVRNKITVTPEELRQGLERGAFVLKLNSFIMDSERDARQLAAALNAAGDTAKTPIPTAGVISHDTITVAAGNLKDAYENAVFLLDSVGAASASFCPGEGWAVFQLLERATNREYAQASQDERRSAVLARIRKRKEAVQAIFAKRDIFTQNVSMDSSVFLAVAGRLRALMLRDTASHKQDTLYTIGANDIDSLRSGLAPMLRKPFVTMGDYSVTLEQIVGEFNYFPVRFSSLRRRSFLQSLNQQFLAIAEAAILSQVAMKKGMHLRPEAQEDLNVWGDALRADLLLKHLLDSLSGEFNARTNATSGTSAAVDAQTNAEETVYQYIARLAGKYNVELYTNRLNDVHVTPSNMVTRRYVGFGGIMMASPMLLRLWEWLQFRHSGKQIPP